jgi:hypothetical protein
MLNQKNYAYTAYCECTSQLPRIAMNIMDQGKSRNPFSQFPVCTEHRGRSLLNVIFPSWGIKLVFPRRDKVQRACSCETVLKRENSVIQRGLIYTENKLLGRLCKMCSPFFLNSSLSNVQRFYSPQRL